MIPKFVMPAVTQKVADLSPMSWGLEGSTSPTAGPRRLPECLPLRCSGRPCCC